MMRDNVTHRPAPSRRLKRLLFCLGAVLAVLLHVSPASLAQVSMTGVLGNPLAGVELDEIRTPAGFTIKPYAKVDNARSLALGERGTVFVGTRQEQVYAVRDEDGDHRADKVVVIADGLEEPNGVAFRNGSLYVAEIGRVIRYEGIESRLDDPPEPVVVNDSFPKEGHHGWKYIAFGPDGMLYVPVGAPCNVCDEPLPFSTIMRMKPDGSDLEVFASGIRNTVGFDFHPRTGVLWFTNNGRDWMGDEQPPDSLHRVPEKGLDFGFPHCHAGVPDPEYGKGYDCEKDFAGWELRMPAHVAPLGMAFYTGSMFPNKYREAVFICEHGSWNRSTPVGYRVTVALPNADGSLEYEVFASGWLQGSSAWGRPVDVLPLEDGSLLVSDDRAGMLYRISYQEVPSRRDQ